MVSSVDVWRSLYEASFYRKNTIGGGISRYFDWLTTPSNPINQYDMFDTTYTQYTSAGYQINGSSVFYLMTPFYNNDRVYNPSPENIELYFNNVVEVPISEWVDGAWWFSRIPQDEREVVLKGVLEEENLYKYATTGWNTARYPCVSWGVPVSENYELYLRYLNACSHRLGTGRDNKFYQINSLKYYDFIEYDSSGNITDEGYGIYHSDSGDFVDNFEKSITTYSSGVTKRYYEEYLVITVTPEEDSFIEKVSVVYSRRQIPEIGETLSFKETYNVVFNLTNGADTIEVRVQEEPIPEPNYLSRQLYNWSRTADKFIEYPTIEFLMDKVGYNEGQDPS